MQLMSKCPSGAGQTCTSNLALLQGQRLPALVCTTIGEVLQAHSRGTGPGGGVYTSKHLSTAAATAVCGLHMTAFPAMQPAA